MPRSGAPDQTALERNAFSVLGATTRDKRPRIVELAEEKTLYLDDAVCSRARADLTNPHNRIAAEAAAIDG